MPLLQLSPDKKGDTKSLAPRPFRKLLEARFILPFAIVVFLLLAILFARTKKPWLDEGLNGSAAYSLVAHGQFGIPQIEETGMTINRRIPEIQHYCYIYGPAYMFAAAAWMKVFSYGMLQLRAFSMLWAVLAMIAWYIAIEKLTRDKVASALGILLLAVNYQFMVEATDGRFDMMCASLGSIALAAFLRFREKNLAEAILLGSLAAAASFFTHPMGVLYGLALVWTILCVDFRRIRPAHAAWFIAPWLICAAGASLWIAPHRNIAQAQFAAATNARWVGLAHPIHSLLTDMSQRYWFFYMGGDNAGVNRLKVLILVLHIAFLFAGFLISRVRSTLAFRVLGPSVLILYVGIAMLDAMKWPYYMVHIFLFASAVVAITVAALRFTSLRYVSALACAVLALVEIGGIGAKIRLNAYGREFVPTINYIRAHTRPGDYIEGEMPLNFGLGYWNPQFHMDNRMGYYTGIRPALIVTGQYADLSYFKDREPDVYRFVLHRLNTEYRQVAQFGDYRIYAPRS